MGFIQKWFQSANGLFNALTSAQAVQLVDDSGNAIGSGNKLPVDAAVTVTANLNVESTGLATSANQVTANASLSSILTALASPAQAGEAAAATASLALESGGNLAAIATAAKNADIKVSAGPLTSESLASAVDFETAFPDLDLTGAVMVTFWTQGGAVCFSPDSGLDATGPQFPPGGIVLHLDAAYAESLYFIAKDSGALLNAIVSVPRNA
jgi:hypothetical protein